MRRQIPASAVPVALAMWAISASAFAGRPLSVDDASTNDVRQGHLEAWLTRSNGDYSWSLAPAYAFYEGVEGAIAMSRDSVGRWHTHAGQLKVSLGPTTTDAPCRTAASVGFTRGSEGNVQSKTSFVIGILTCKMKGTFVHVNLGTSKFTLATNESKSAKSGGVAWEFSFNPLSLHAEALFASNVKPTWGFGARTPLSTSLQLDGSWSRQKACEHSDRRTQVSVLVCSPGVCCNDMGTPRGPTIGENAQWRLQCQSHIHFRKIHAVQRCQNS